MSNTYFITVIVPFYNLSSYLRSCLDSIAMQSLGMENIQVILVNDGSTDDSESICHAFKGQYPDNVVYIKQDNLGVSAARNKGIDLAEGQLTTFLDGDDKWSSDSFEIAYAASVLHPDISIFSCKMEFFDAKSGSHQLNYKYNKDRIIDINKIYNYPQMSSSSTFIKTDLVRRYRFVEGIKYSEDFRFISEMLMEVGEYMVLEKPTYMYRCRPSEDSAMQNSVTNLEYYIPACKNVYKYLFDESVKKYGYVMRYLQFCVMYDLRAKLKIPLASTGMSEGEAKKYCSLLKDLLSQIDDDIILEQKRIAPSLKLYAIELKKNRAITDELSINSSGLICYKDIPVFDLSRKTVVRINSLSAAGDYLKVFGSVTIPFYDNLFSLRYCINSTYYDLSLTKTQNNAKTYLHGIINSDYDFNISVPISDSIRSELSFEICFDSRPFFVRPKCVTDSSLDKRQGFTKVGDVIVCRYGKELAIMKNNLRNTVVAVLLRLFKRHIKLS